MPRRADIRIGISGWRYLPWRKSFYPKGLPQRLELEFASSRLSSIELNGSFYSLQRPSSYRQWYKSTPDGFVFSVKGPNYITHMKRLRDVREPLANFFASGVLELREKFGPMLWQFPPNFAFNPELFEAFFQLLPRDTTAAAKLAREHTDILKFKASMRTDADRPIRHAIEIRHESFKNPQFIELLRKHRIALVFADAAARWPYMEDVTADFVYLRLHGAKEMYASGYENADLDRWAEKIKLWTTGKEPLSGPKMLDKFPPQRAARDAFIYFDNDIKVHAPFNAQDLARRLKVNWAPDHEERTVIKNYATPATAPEG